MLISASIMLRSLITFFLAASFEAVVLPAIGPTTRWAGRVVAAPSPAPAGAATWDWPGVRVTISVPANTSAVTATLLVPPPLRARLRVLVDGVAGPPMDIGSASAPQTVKLATLNGSASTVALVSVLEPALQHPQPYLPAAPYAAVELHSLELVDAESALPPPSQPARKIVFVGDSITAGFGAGGTAGNCPAPEVYSEDNSVTYGALLCGDFGAACETVAWSGKGLYINSPTAGTNETLPEYYYSAMGAGRPPYAHDWDFSSATKPSLIVFNLGTNDYGHGRATDANFTAAFVAFFRELAALHGDAQLPLFAGCGPLTSKPVAAIRAAVAEYNAGGGAAHFLDLGLGAASGCYGHPSASDHAAMAALARPQIATVMGW